MKLIISALMIVLFANFSNAQTLDDYPELWKKVSDFENKGLPKSALKIVETIEKKAKASQNQSQQIKTLLYKSKYALTLEEDAQFEIISDFKSAIAKSKSPTKNILHNFLGTLYWQYFNQNRYKFYNRTKIGENENSSDSSKSSDFRTWDLKTLFQEVHFHYQSSLENTEILQQTNIKEFEALLIEQPNSETYRPTLFDLLSHNALEFYK
ncbi:MAG: alpha-2-macroglobulin, partial [Psychroserpens sp.]